MNDRFQSLSYESLRRLTTHAPRVRRIGITFAMYREQKRLLPRSASNPHGEDALRGKIAQLQELSQINPDLKWDLVAVEAGSDRPSPTDPTSGEVAQTILRDLDQGTYQKGVWQSADGRIRVWISTLPAEVQQRLHGSKGSAIVWGLLCLLQEQADLLIYTDTDLSADLRLSGLLIAPWIQGKRWVVGSRLHRDSWVTGRRWSTGMTSRLYSWIARMLLPLSGIVDTQAGFKLFDKDLLKTILPLRRPAGSSDWEFETDFDYGMSFDTELLGRAVLSFGGRLGAETPIAWHDSPMASTIRSGRLNKVGWQMLRGLWRQRGSLRRFQVQPRTTLAIETGDALLSTSRNHKLPVEDPFKKQESAV